ncbi:MAG: 4-carboxymuconolactone decarboxylase [Alphaproteobacteria bacterium]|jgi:4-carboxymuconolactone decarboxylase|nr:4-carboxymuconolactone decarboxylase [Alphaproteobacteria bacterium]
MPTKKTLARRTPARKPPRGASKTPPIRLPAIPEASYTPAQRALIAAISSGPRGQFKLSGPFFCYLHAPGFGELAQTLGAHLRFGTGIPPRLSEFAILATAQQWKSQYEWSAHVGIAEQKGLKPETIRDLRAGRVPKKAPKDEKAIYAFVQELYRHKRVSDATYKAVNAILGDVATVELVGLLGYYAMVAMTLDVFRMPVKEGTPPPFKEPTVG